MVSWMSRTALELMGQAGLGYTFDPLTADAADEFGEALKGLMYVLIIPYRWLACAVLILPSSLGTLH